MGIKKIMKCTISYSLTILMIGGIIASFIWTPEAAPFLGELEDISLFMIILAYLFSAIFICCVAAAIVWIGFCIRLISDIVHRWLWKEKGSMI
jgi:hypothetical protein